jgi:hypothetical protein
MPQVKLKRAAMIPGRMFQAGEVADVTDEVADALRRAEVLDEGAAPQAAEATPTDQPPATRPRK